MQGIRESALVVESANVRGREGLAVPEDQARNYVGHAVWRRVTVYHAGVVGSFSVPHLNRHTVTGTLEYTRHDLRKRGVVGLQERGTETVEQPWANLVPLHQPTHEPGDTLEEMTRAAAIGEHVVEFSDGCFWQQAAEPR